MPTLESCMLAELAIIDESTKHVSLINIFDGVTVRERPTVAGAAPAGIRAVLLLRWRLDEDDKLNGVTFRVSFRRERERKSIASAEMAIPPGTSFFHRATIRMASVPTAAPGLHVAVVEVKHGSRWKEAGRCTYDVELDTDASGPVEH